MMPLDLLLVRHGESEQNLANKRSRDGDDSLLTPEFAARPNSQHRLSVVGRGHALSAGDWLERHNLNHFDRCYVSDYVRAKETAALLDLVDAEWYVDNALREREWGDWDSIPAAKRESMLQRSVSEKDVDPFYWIPPNGESIAQLTTARLQAIFSTLHRECSDKQVIIVCHGDLMSGFRQRIERTPLDRWRRMNQSEDPHHRIHNCQILHYTRRDPATGVFSEHLDWVRSVCPWNESLSSNEWQRIERLKFSNEQLLRAVEKAPPLFEDEH